MTMNENRNGPRSAIALIDPRGGLTRVSDLFGLLRAFRGCPDSCGRRRRDVCACDGRRAVRCRRLRRWALVRPRRPHPAPPAPSHRPRGRFTSVCGSGLQTPFLFPRRRGFQPRRAGWKPAPREGRRGLAPAPRRGSGAAKAGVPFRGAPGGPTGSRPRALHAPMRLTCECRTRCALTRRGAHENGRRGDFRRRRPYSRLITCRLLLDEGLSASWSRRTPRWSW